MGDDVGLKRPYANWLKIGAKGFAALAILALVALLFQNCLPASTTKVVEVAAMDDGGGGNGGGYQGKIFVHVLASGACSDGSKIEAAISYEESGAFLIRNECKDLLGGRPIQVTLQLVDGQPSIIYDGKVFVLADSDLKTLGRDPVAMVTESSGDFYYVDSRAIGKMTADGAPIWAKQLPKDYVAASARLTGDGKLLLVGKETSTKRAFAALWSSSGQALWVKTYAVAPATVNTAESVRIDEAGRFVVAGSTRGESDAHSSPFLLVLDDQGEPVWWRRYPARANGTSVRLAISDQGEIFAKLGSVLSKISSAGQTAWSRRFSNDQPSQGQNKYIQDMVSDNDGGVWAGGMLTVTSLAGVSIHLGYLGRFDSSGTQIHGKTIVFNSPANEQGVQSLALVSDHTLQMTATWTRGQNTKFRRHAFLKYRPGDAGPTGVSYTGNPSSRPLLAVRTASQSLIADNALVFSFSGGATTSCPLVYLCSPANALSMAEDDAPIFSENPELGESIGGLVSGVPLTDFAPIEVENALQFIR